MFDVFKSNKRFQNLNFVILITLVIFSLHVHASAEPEITTVVEQEESDVVSELVTSPKESEDNQQVNQILISEKVLDVLLENVSAKENPTQSSENTFLLGKIVSLKSEVQSLKAQTEPYKKALREKDDSSNSFLISAVLTGATLIITVLAVIFAIVSFIGYKQIISAAEDKAEKAAVKKTEELVQARIKDGKFDESISDAIEMIAMRGIFDPSLEKANSQEDKK